MSTKTKKITIQEINPTTAQEWVRKGAVLVDVREPDEVDRLAFDVPHILNLPLSSFEQRYKEIPQGQDVVMVCKGGGRSQRATGFMVNHGYQKVVNMQEGIAGWVRKGLPTKGDTTEVTGSDSCCSSSGCC